MPCGFYSALEPYFVPFGPHTLWSRITESLSPSHPAYFCMQMDFANALLQVILLYESHSSLFSLSYSPVLSQVCRPLVVCEIQKVGNHWFKEIAYLHRASSGTSSLGKTPVRQSHKLLDDTAHSCNFTFFW